MSNRARCLLLSSYNTSLLKTAPYNPRTMYDMDPIQKMAAGLIFFCLN